MALGISSCCRRKWKEHLIVFDSSSMDILPESDNDFRVTGENVFSCECLHMILDVSCILLEW